MSRGEDAPVDHAGIIDFISVCLQKTNPYPAENTLVVEFLSRGDPPIGPVPGLDDIAGLSISDRIIRYEQPRSSEQHADALSEPVIGEVVCRRFRKTAAAARSSSRRPTILFISLMRIEGSFHFFITGMITARMTAFLFSNSEPVVGTGLSSRTMMRFLSAASVKGTEMLDSRICPVIEVTFPD